MSRFTSLFAVTSPTTRATTLTLVRHGESDWNATRRTQGQDDRAQLSARGREQAREVAATLRDGGFDLVVTSDLARARETADIIADTLGVPVVTDPLLRERCFGVLEGGPLADVTATYSGIEGGRLIDPDARPADGESFRDVVARARRFVSEVASRWPDRRLLVVTHGGMVRALRAYCDDVPLEGLVWDPVENCTVWTLEASVTP